MKLCLFMENHYKGGLDTFLINLTNSWPDEQDVLTLMCNSSHPGLATIGFPAPNKNGVWRFPKFSYRRILAKPHPNARRGNPA